MVFKPVVINFLNFAAPLRRFGASSSARMSVLVIGLAALTAYTVPDLQRTAGVWLSACLWSCLAYFAIDGVVRANAATRGGKIWSHIFSFSGLVDLIAVIAVPTALLCGVPSMTAWLLASLWVLKLAQDSPGFAQLHRVFVVEAKALASVFALFLIVLFLSSAAMFLIERHAQPTAFNSMPQALWWAVVTLTTTGYGDKVPITDLGRLLGGIVMICGIATFGLSTGILATGFAAETRRRNFIRTWDLVSKVPFFQSLDPAAITEITHLLRLLEVPERTAIIRRGKIGDCMYFIAAGEVQVDVKPSPVRLGPGAFFGELALLGDSVRSANVTTTMPATLLILDLADFRTFTANHPDLKRAIDAEAERRMNQNQDIRERQRFGGSSPG
ncbi:MAG TPA: cyclic nucleotide-gated ion channel [Bradyrhizobium sp.]|nr:cyclic nucleotide-gated ion channel [Bradyrhizobium sp.]